MRSALPGPGGRLQGGLTHLRSGRPLGRGGGRIGPARGRPPEHGAWRRALVYLRWLAIPLLLALLVLIASRLDQRPPDPTTFASHSPKPRTAAPPHSDRPRHPGPKQIVKLRQSEPEQNPSGGPSKPPAAEPESLQSGGGNGGVGQEEETNGKGVSEPPPHRPQTFRHLTIHHLHHLRILWLWDWELLALVVACICLYLLARQRLTPTGPLLAALILSIALGLSGLVTALALHQVSGPGTYVVNPIKVVDEEENSEGDRFIELEKPIDHYHPPLEANVALLLLAAGLMELAVPPGHTLMRELRKRARRRRELARAKAAAALARSTDS